MELVLPEVVAVVVAPLFEVLPLDRAMADLVVSSTPKALSERVDALARVPAIGSNAALVAGLWLYVDDLDRSHAVSQGIEDSTGAFWHGIMHRREGDFSNSHYWFRRVGQHPAMEAISGYDGHAFIAAVEAGYRDAPAELVQMQRAEWCALFMWCARVGSGNA